MESEPTVFNQEGKDEERRVSFWSFFREAGHIPLGELLKREDGEELAVDVPSPTGSDKSYDLMPSLSKKLSKSFMLPTFRHSKKRESKV